MCFVSEKTSTLDTGCTNIMMTLKNGGLGPWSQPTLRSNVETSSFLSNSHQRARHQPQHHRSPPDHPPLPRARRLQLVRSVHPPDAPRTPTVRQVHRRSLVRPDDDPSGDVGIRKRPIFKGSRPVVGSVKIDRVTSRLGGAGAKGSTALNRRGAGEEGLGIPIEFDLAVERVD